jgi:hypothetical protein
VQITRVTDERSRAIRWDNAAELDGVDVSTLPVGAGQMNLGAR